MFEQLVMEKLKLRVDGSFELMEYPDCDSKPLMLKEYDKDGKLITVTRVWNCGRTSILRIYEGFKNKA